MSADDILRGKQKRNGQRNVSNNPDILRQRQQMHPQIQIPKRYSSTNNYLQYQRNTGNMVKKQLTLAQATGRLIGLSARKLVDSAADILKTATKVSFALLAVVGYLKQKNTFDLQGYSNVDRFLGKKPGTPGGFASFGKGSLSSGRTSERMRNKIKADEGGFQSKAYWDKDGYSIGYGHHGKVDGKPIYKGQVISKEKAEQLFDQDIAKFENGVKRQLQKAGITTPISQNMFDAMVNYSYNAGSLGPKFLKKLKAGDYKGAAAELEVGEENKARMAEIRKTFLVDVSDANKLTVEAINKNVEIIQTSAGKRKRYATGKTTSTSNPKIGNYQLWNPNTQRGYIELSERAEKYIADVGGKGIITSGSEGLHAGGTVSHGAGNKIDVVAYGTSKEAWADCAIPFIRNKNTAFVNFEDFDETTFKEIKKIIYRKISQDLIDKCETIQIYMNKDIPQPFLTRSHTGGGLHLDIGILPNAYDPKTQPTQSKTNNVKTIPPTQTKPTQQTTTTQTQTSKKGGIPQVPTPTQTQNIPSQDNISTGKVNYFATRWQQLNTKRKNTKS